MNEQANKTNEARPARSAEMVASRILFCVGREAQSLHTQPGMHLPKAHTLTGRKGMSKDLIQALEEALSVCQ